MKTDAAGAGGRAIDGLLFDKDGTLFDFHGTWGVWAGGVIEHLSGGDAGRAADLARAIHYDLGARQFHDTSPAIAGTNREVAELLADCLPGAEAGRIETYLMTSSATAPLVPVLDLVDFIAGLRARGLRLGVMTNDAEFSARAHLAASGIGEAFDFIAGFDSGHGAKPDAAPLLAFARAEGLAPERVAMVGDSTHDLVAGRAAGMVTVAVLTGTAPEAELAPYADVVLPDIGYLPAWLDSRG
ncbi:HAD family hydrolase [Roseovarius nubinhibens]|uniref:phosphoglycolate phosphatase n=1 Tax=Roseovarius nubinhibens (strain ATCC BAA-591 / DSM 15170 / ISM) TaxID=89187 RepID=A3SMA6_ROSNI|nr:HAD family hydrolase [Roseovarius nubinhibens]EAP75585.1 HAD-superfamily hydrolase, subfamily IA, variant 1 family protein [Roseovarius nubinhibens ISM]